MPLRPSRRRTWILTLVAVLVAILAAVHELPRWRVAPFADFSNIQTGAQCLIAGCDPYDSKEMNREVARRHDVKVEIWQMSPVYPPSALILALPWQGFRWPLAAQLFDLTGAALIVLCIGMMLWQFRLQLADPAALILLALLISDGLALCVHFANPALLEAGLAALACLLLLRPNRASDWPAIGSLGLALALKPQLAFGIVVVLLMRRDTRVPALRACGIALLLLIVGIVTYRLRLGSFHYLATLRTAFTHSVAPLASSDFDSNYAFEFLNLQATYAVIHHIGRRTIIALAWLTTVALAGAAITLARRTDALQRRPWTMIAVGQTISLLPIYHRGYDRVIALLLLPAAIELAGTRRWLAWLYAGFIAIWLTNEKITTYIFTKLRFQPQNPVEELAFLLVLLGSLSAIPRQSSSIVE